MNTDKQDESRIFAGSFFFFEDGELSFTCRTRGIDFNTVKAGLTKLRDEIDRQLNNETNCPLYKSKPYDAEPDPKINPSRIPGQSMYKGCHSHNDGDCTWEHCPQLRDNEPHKSGRHCPLDVDDDEL